MENIMFRILVIMVMILGVIAVIGVPLFAIVLEIKEWREEKKKKGGKL